MHRGLTRVVAAGQELARPLWLVRLGEAAGHVGQVAAGGGRLAQGLAALAARGRGGARVSRSAAGRRRLAEALAGFAASGRGDLLAEAHRLQGELWLRQIPPDTAQADACFPQALAIAPPQQAARWASPASSRPGPGSCAPR